jgi:competence protein ComGC
MKSQREKIILITIVVIVVTCLPIIFVFIGKNNKTVEDTILENTVTFITKQVTDYPEDIDGMPLIWESVYDEQNSISRVYAEGKEIKSFSGGSIEKIVDFSPEVKGNLKTVVDVAIANDAMGIIYSLDMDQSLTYVADLIDSGYRIMRKVLTAEYAEVYLKSPEEKTIRILALSDKMLMAELNKEVVLDNIDSYFN